MPGGLPAGFRAAGVACGLKPSGAPDLGLLVSDAPDTVSAARFTRSGVLAAPVLLTQERCQLTGIRAVVANAGNANAATGRRGLEDAARMQGAGAMVAGVLEDRVAVASTGVIGVPLDTDKVIRGIADARRELAPDGDGDFGAAIRTTDAFPKNAALQVALPSGTVRLCAQAKGAGHDLALLRDDALLRRDRRGAAGGDRRPAARRVRQALVRSHLGRRAALHQRHGDPDGVGRQRRDASSPSPRTSCASARRSTTCCGGSRSQIARDGEGAARVGRVVVHGGHEESVVRAARAVADSPLVKAALHGGDPNWGRIAQAVGAALHDTAPLPLDIWIEDVQVCRAGAALPFDESALAGAVAGEEVEYSVGLPGEGAEAEVFFSDLSHDYVTINAEYTT